MAMALLTTSPSLKIAVVGANDGAINDPIFSFAREFRNRVSILLIEPQPSLIPYLRENYWQHPDATIVNCAVGASGTLSLFAVKPAYWDKLSVPYARNWPPYRAPTGVTSFSRDRVAGWLADKLPPGTDLDDAIHAFDVPASDLRHITETHGFGPHLDILQVDAEGADDVVLYNSNLPLFRPKLIHYESVGLDAEKDRKLSEYLTGLGYMIIPDGTDTIAIALA
jgi:FkbM family methyltransferase